MGLKLIQQQPEGTVMTIDQDAKDDLGPQLTPWQEYFSKQSGKLFNRVGKIKNYKVQENFFEKLNAVQQKGQRVPITRQEEVDKEITKLLEQGHIEN